MLVAEGLGGLVAFQAETRLQAARGVVDAGMDHATVVAGLVPGRAGLFLQQEDFCVRVNLGQLHGRGHAHDAAADDDEVVHSHSLAPTWIRFLLEHDKGHGWPCHFSLAGLIGRAGTGFSGS